MYWLLLLILIRSHHQHHIRFFTYQHPNSFMPSVYRALGMTLLLPLSLSSAWSLDDPGRATPPLHPDASPEDTDTLCLASMVTVDSPGDHKDNFTDKSHAEPIEGGSLYGMFMSSVLFASALAIGVFAALLFFVGLLLVRPSYGCMTGDARCSKQTDEIMVVIIFGLMGLIPLVPGFIGCLCAAGLLILSILLIVAYLIRILMTVILVGYRLIRRQEEPQPDDELSGCGGDESEDINGSLECQDSRLIFNTRDVD